MYESKKNSARKEMYKYQKSSYQKNFHNTTHFNYHKYNKYKQKYNHSNSIQDYDEETILNTQQVHDWDKATAPTNPTREWYKFTWRNPTFTASSPVYASATYIAEYEEDKE